MTPLEIYFIVRHNLTEYFNELTSPFCTEESVKVKFDMLMKAFDLLLPMSRSLGSDLLDLVYGLDKAVNDRALAPARESWVAINKLIVAHLGLDTDHAGETVH